MIDETLYAERNRIYVRVTTAQDRHDRAEFDAAAAELRAFDIAHPEIKAEVGRRLREHHARRNPFVSKI